MEVVYKRFFYAANFNAKCACSFIIATHIPHHALISKLYLYCGSSQTSCGKQRSCGRFMLVDSPTCGHHTRHFSMEFSHSVPYHLKTNRLAQHTPSFHRPAKLPFLLHRGRMLGFVSQYTAAPKKKQPLTTGIPA